MAVASAAAGARPEGRPLSWLFDPIANVLRWIIERILGILIVLMIILGIFLVWSPLQTVFTHLGDSIATVWNSFATIYTNVQYSISCAMGGECAPPPEGVDPREYGITLSSVKPLMNKFREQDSIVFEAVADATLLTSMNKNSPVKVTCGLEDGTLKSQNLQSVPMRDIDGALLRCVYEPQVSLDSDNERKATINLTYDFEGSTYIPISIVSASDYERWLQEFAAQTDSIDDAKAMLAQHYNVQQSPNAIAKKTPIQSGAYINRDQPIPKGQQYVTLVLNVKNRGTGYAQLNNVDVNLPQGMALSSMDEINFDPPNPIELSGRLFDSWVLHKESNPSMEEVLAPGESKIYNFVIDTSGFPLESQTEATNTNINVGVEYTYTVSKSTYVVIRTCAELGDCEERRAAAGEPAS